MQYTLLYIFTNKNTLFTEGFYLQWTKFLSIYILSLYINNYKKNKNKSFVQILRYGYLPPTTQAKINFLWKWRERTSEVPEVFYEIFLRDKEKASCESATTNFKKNLWDQGSASEKARKQRLVISLVCRHNLVPRAFPSKNGWGREKALASAGHVGTL